MATRLIFAILCLVTLTGVSQYFDGFEEGALGVGTVKTIDGWYDNGSTGASITTDNVQFGTYALRTNATSGVPCEAVVTGGDIVNSWWIQSGSSRTYFLGANLRVASLPSVARRMMVLASALGRGAYLRMNTDGTITFFTTASGTPEYTSTLAAPIGSYIYVCLKTIVINSGASFCGFTMQVGADKEAFNSTAYLTVGSPENITYFSLGDGTASTGTFDYTWDNILLNDNQTGDEMSYPTNSFVADLQVNSDSSVGTWTLEDGGTTGLNEALNNLPYGKATEDATNTVINTNSGGNQKLYLGFQTPLSVGITNDYDIIYYSIGIRFGAHTSTSAVIVSGKTSSNPTNDTELSNVTSTTAHSTADNNTTSTNYRTRYVAGGNALRQSLFLNTPTVMYVNKVDAVATRVCVSKVWAKIRFVPAIIPKQR